MDELSSYRLEMAYETLHYSKVLLDAGGYSHSINRSYYAIFSAIRALLAKRDIDFSKHSAVIGYFRREYIKTGIFDKKYSDYLKYAFQTRNDCDYGAFVKVTKEQATEQYSHAAELIDEIRRYLGK